MRRAPFLAGFLFLSSAAGQSVPVSQASSAELEATVRSLSGAEPISTSAGEIQLVSRSVDHPHLPLAGAWIAQRFEEVSGLQVRQEPFSWQGRALFNVVADRPGAEPDRPMIVLGAHYDSIATFTDGWDSSVDAAPGADDDASGVAALLEIARLLRGVPLRAPVRFVAFSAEEVGLVGSTAHVAGLGDDPVQLMVSLDPIGYNPAGEGWLWVAYDGRWPEAALALEAVAQASDVLRLTAMDEAVIGGDERSDHFPFWEAQIPALHLGSFPQPPTYHTVDDTVDVVDFTFLAAVTDLVTAYVVDAAGVVEVEAPVVEPRGCGS